MFVCSKVVVHESIHVMLFLPKPFSKTFYVVYEGRTIISACLVKYANRLLRNLINSCFEKKLVQFGMDRTAGLRITVYVHIKEIECILFL